MDQDTLTALLTAGAPAAAIVIWLIRLEGRVNTHDAINQQLRSDVSYIRERIDKALNGHGA